MNIVIAGASSGIGAALAERVERNHSVLKLSRSAGCDLTDYQNAVAATVMLPEVHALIITAGHQATLGRIETCDPAAWAKAIDANLLVVFNAIKAFYPLLKRAKRPKVIAIGGGGASQGRPYFSSYACAKTAVVRLMETLAMEEPGWDVNTVAPGAINTRMLDAVLESDPALLGHEEYQKAQEQKRSGGDSMAKALDLIEWLISPEADGVSGRLISARWDNYNAGWADEKNWGKLRRMTPQ